VNARSKLVNQLQSIQQYQYKKTNPGGRHPSPQPQRAHVRRLTRVRLEGQEIVRVLEGVGICSVFKAEFPVDVRHHLRVVVVETRYDDLVEVDDDDVAIAVDVSHHTVIE